MSKKINIPPFTYDGDIGEIYNEEGQSVLQAVNVPGTSIEDQDVFMEMVALMLNKEA